jgi:hypothetical protein
MEIKGSSAVGCSVYAYVSAFSRCCGMAGDLSTKVKGIANCTKAQVPAQLPERVSSKCPLQYHQTAALPTKSVDWFLKLLKN